LAHHSTNSFFNDLDSVNVAGMVITIH